MRHQLSNVDVELICRGALAPTSPRAPLTGYPERAWVIDEMRKAADEHSPFLDPREYALANGLALDERTPSYTMWDPREQRTVAWVWSPDPRENGLRIAWSLGGVLLNRWGIENRPADRALLAMEMLLPRAVCPYFANAAQARRMQTHCPEWLIAVALEVCPEKANPLARAPHVRIA